MALAQLDTNSLTSKRIPFAGLSPDDPASKPNHLGPEQLAVTIQGGYANNSSWLIIHTADRIVIIDNLAAFLDVSGPEVQLKPGHQTILPLNGSSIDHVIIDESLIGAEQLILKKSDSDKYLSISGQDFIRLFDRYQLLAFTACTPDQSGLITTEKTALHHALSIKKKLSQPIEIPPLTSTAQQLIEISADPCADADDLVRLVELDPSLAGQVVGWASSPYYSAPGVVDSIQDAIVRVLGFDLVLNMALGLALGAPLSQGSMATTAKAHFWRQSICCAVLMQKLNNKLPAKRQLPQGTAYLIGLLNNLGQLIINFTFPAQDVKLVHHLQFNPGIPPRFIEQILMGVTRDEIAAHIGTAWQLPKPIVMALLEQNNSHYQDDHANLCYVATRLLSQHQIGLLPQEPIDSCVLGRLELSSEYLDQAMDEITEKKAEIDQLVVLMSC